MQLHHARGARIELGEAGQRGIEFERLAGIDAHAVERAGIERGALQVAAVLRSQVAARVIDQQVAHRACGVADVIAQGERAVAPADVEVDLVHERGCVDRVASADASTLASRDQPQALVDVVERGIRGSFRPSFIHGNFPPAVTVAGWSERAPAGFVKEGCRSRRWLRVLVRDTLIEERAMHRLPTCLLAVVAAFAAAPVPAAIYTVGSGAGCTHATIQAAIDAADAASSTGADEIRLAGGPYTAQALTMHIAAAHGAVALNGGYATCTSPTPTVGARTIVGGRSSGADPALRISDTADATLRNLEIRDATSGGGLVVETNAAGSAASMVELVDTIVVHNASVNGGGILVANYNPSTPQDRLQLRLSGTSEVAYNIGRARGGGIHCDYATVAVQDASSVHENQAGDAGFAGSHDGGGVHADDCRLDLTSSDARLLYRNSIAAGGRGGGLYLTGAQGSADFYAVSSGMLTFVRENRATDGGGIAIAGGAQVRMFGGGGLLDNSADASGGAVWIAPGTSAGIDTRFLAQSTLEGAPENAVACPSPEFCSMIRGNRVVDVGGHSGIGAALLIDTADGGTAHATLRGVRIEQNDGFSLLQQGTSRSRVTLDGVLVTDNHVDGGFAAIVGLGPDTAVVVQSTTIANNTIAAGTLVFGTPTTCDVADDEVGIHLRRSIIWQPGHGLLFSLFEPPQANCFDDLVANDFGMLGAAADRVVADPAFENVAGGNYRLSATSPALDFAPAHAGDATLDNGARVIDLPAVTNLFGPQDLGAFERSYSPTVIASVSGTGGTITPSSQAVVYGQVAHLGVFAFGGYHAILPFGGDCPVGTLDGANYTTGPITAACSVVASFIHGTTITLASSAEPSVYGQSVTFTATLAAAAPTGSVTFRDGATVLGSAPLSGVSANFTTTALGVGAHSITAQYAGDGQNTPATSPALAQTVNRAATITTILPTTPIRLGQAATIIATVSAASPGSGTPTGTIEVLVGFGSGSGGCTITLPAASCTLTPVNVTGVLTLSASYSGDAQFSASVGTQTLQVTPQFVGGTITGLTAESLVLRLSVGGDEVQVIGAPIGASTFAFSTAVAVGASYTVNVATHPGGLFCTVSNGSGTMPAGDVASVAVACSSAPHAILSVAVNDGIVYARYGQTLVYSVTLTNSGNADASAVAVTALASPGLDTSALTWTCVAGSGGAACGASGVGGLADNAALPIGRSVTYTVIVPVLATTAEPRVRFEVRANGDEAMQSDSDALVLLRNGFDGT